METPKSIALAGSQPSVSRRRPEVLICIKASAFGFDAIAAIAAYRSMPRSSPMPDIISSLSLRTCSCRLSTAGVTALRNGSRSAPFRNMICAAPNIMPRFREGLAELQAFYERILEQAFGASEGVWLGTPFNLNL